MCRETSGKRVPPMGEFQVGVNPKMVGLPQQTHGVFLVKMIILGWRLGVPPFKETPQKHPKTKKTRWKHPIWGYHHFRAWFFYTLPENKENSLADGGSLPSRCGKKKGGGWKQRFSLFSPLFGEDSYFDSYFSNGWFNHQLETYFFHIIWAWIVASSLSDFHFHGPLKLPAMESQVDTGVIGLYLFGVRDQHTALGGGCKHFLFSSRPIWGNDPIWLIFFRWVGSTNN